GPAGVNVLVAAPHAADLVIGTDRVLGLQRLAAAQSGQKQQSQGNGNAHVGAVRGWHRASPCVGSGQEFTVRRRLDKVNPRRTAATEARGAISFSSDRVASGRYRPEAPTDPYVLALEHTVLQITGSLLVCKPNAQCARQPAGSAGADGGNGSSSSTACDCGGRATSASDAEPPRETS